jgi:hypothetical protein
LGLRDVYGRDLPARLMPDSPHGLSATVKVPPDADAWLYVARIEETPVAWLTRPPFSKRHPCPSVVMEGCRVHLDDLDRRGHQVPQWEVAASWWASQVAMLPDPAPHADSVGWLAAQLAGWRERYEYALRWWSLWGRSDPRKLFPGDDQWHAMWRGYRTDLRYSASLGRAEAMRSEGGGELGYDPARFSWVAEPVWPSAMQVSCVEGEPAACA